MLSGTYRHLSNALMRKVFSIFVLQICLQRARKSKSESNFLASPFGSEADRLPPAGSGGGVLFIIYEFGFLRQNLYRAAQSILETGQTAVCKCCQAGGRAKSIPNIVISNTLRATRKCPLPSRLKLLGLFHLQTFTCCTAARQIHVVGVHLQVVFWTRGGSFCF